MRSAVRAFVCAACLGVLVTADARPPTRRDAETMRTKIDAIYAQGAQSSAAGLRTTVTEPEVNAYLTFDSVGKLPQGVEDPYVAMMGGGRVTARAMVNLDSVKSEGSGGMFNPLRLLSGRLPVSTTGVLRTSAGSARFDLESAEVSGITVPRSVLEQVLSYYSKTPENPNGLSLDEPFPLPARIQRIDVGAGEAVVVQ